MLLEYSESNRLKTLQNLRSINDTISQLINWNRYIISVDDYYASEQGMQLLTANCTLITAIGEGVNRVLRILPDFLQNKFPNTPWLAIIGMRNHIAHGYFELDADLVFEAVHSDIPALKSTIEEAISLLMD